jgi:hypothetical protein
MAPGGCIRPALDIHGDEKQRHAMHCLIDRECVESVIGCPHFPLP